MTPNPATMTVQEAIEFAMKEKGWRAIVGRGSMLSSLENKQ